MRYWTLVHYDFSRSKEGSMRYSREDGKILLFASWKAASDYKRAKMLARGEVRDWYNTVSEYTGSDKLRKDHKVMPDTMNP